MQADELFRVAPTVHMAPASSWPSIQAHGLLTTEGLLDLYGVLGERRDSILRKRRDKAEPLEHPTLPTITIRDQKPMKYLWDKIEPSSTVEQYLTAINARVFFWASPTRLARLLTAREYRNDPQVVLHVDTAKLLAVHGPRVQLCRFNSGAITQVNHPDRGHGSWMPIASYPYDEYRRRYGRGNALAEVTVVGGVPDVLTWLSKSSSHRPVAGRSDRSQSGPAPTISRWTEDLATRWVDVLGAPGHQRHGEDCRPRLMPTSSIPR